MDFNAHKKRLSQAQIENFIIILQVVGDKHLSQHAE